VLRVSGGFDYTGVVCEFDSNGAPFIPALPDSRDAAPATSGGAAAGAASTGLKHSASSESLNSDGNIDHPHHDQVPNLLKIKCHESSTGRCRQRRTGILLRKKKKVDQDSISSLGLA